MHKDKFVFSWLTEFLDRNKFSYIVRKYGGDKYVKHFTCWNQLLALMFGQLSNRESLRDLVVAIDTYSGRYSATLLDNFVVLLQKWHRRYYKKGWL